MLGFVHGVIYWFRIDPYPARAALLVREAETALRLAPDLPQAHWAMACAILWGQNGDRRRVLAELMIAAQGLPGSGELWMMIAGVNMGIGELERALSAYEKAVELDPRYAQTFVELAGIYQRLRRFGDAVAAFDRAIALAPDVSEMKVDRAMLDARWRGRLDAMRALVAAQGCGKPDLQYLCACLALWQRTPDSIAALFPRPERVVFDWQSEYTPALLYVAWAHQMRGDSAAARSAFAGALRQLDSALQRLPGDWRVHASRGIALAGVGRRVEARQEAEWMGNSYFYRTSSFISIYQKSAQARIFAQAGMAGEAVGKIEFLISVGSETVHSLQFDPRWDPIRRDPQFQALLRRQGGP
jgi:tetratricopeptide (TPR) repeat protein